MGILKYIKNVQCRFYSLKFGNRGFSLLEVIMSAVAMSVFGLLVHSMLLMGHSFTESQKNKLTISQFIGTIQQKICKNNLAFKIDNLNYLNTYSFSDTGTDFPYTQYKPSVGTAIKPILKLDINKKNIIYNKNSKNNVELDLTSKEDLFYNIYNDSHTIVKVYSSYASTVIRDFNSGQIFASRCVKNNKNVIHTVGGGKTTFDPKNIIQSTVNILETLPYKPYYLPRNTNMEKILCCKQVDGVFTCDKQNAYTPRIYLIHIKPVVLSATELLKSHKKFFIGSVSYIQELPELQDINNIWGMGFLLSVKGLLGSNQGSQQSPFTLYLMDLKNTCVTSLNHIQKCKTLFLGLDLNLPGLTQQEGALKSMTFKKYIKRSTYTCSGYSSGIGTTNVISL